LEAFYNFVDESVDRAGGAVFTTHADSIFAGFGGAMHVDHPELRACICSKQITEHGATHAVAVRLSIGIATASMFVMNLGIKKFVNYSVGGEAVEVAKRLEHFNGLFGTSILATSSTLTSCHEFVATRRVPSMRILTQQEPFVLEAWEVLGPHVNAPV